MKALHSLALTCLFLLALASCKSTEEFTQRKYTEGYFHDFSLGKSKTEKWTPDTLMISSEDPAQKISVKKIATNLTEAFDVPPVVDFADPGKMLHSTHPAIATKIDSAIARRVAKDSSWSQDTLPACIETALGSQACLGVASVSAMITSVAPEFIWFAWIPVVLSPVALLVSLITGFIAIGKIPFGKIDRRYNRYMKLWAVALLINLCLAAVVIFTYAA